MAFQSLPISQDLYTFNGTAKYNIIVLEGISTAFSRPIDMNLSVRMRSLG